LSQPELSIVVPAYNEAARIEATLRGIAAHLQKRGLSYELIVAADGDDGTRERAAALAAQDARLSVLGGPGRGGKGRGIRLGFERARGRLLGFVDADDKTPIEELDRLLPWFDEGYDVVIGSRGQADSKIEVAQPLHRRLGSRAFRVVMHAATGLWQLTDTQCGFKFFRAEAARDLFSRQRIDGYMFDVEVLYLAVREGYRIKEVGVRWRDDGDSRLELLSGNWKNLKDVLGLRLHRYPRRQKPLGHEAPGRGTA
jgi:dolichyl-phosphate beta-glucosyltransferase